MLHKLGADMSAASRNGVTPLIAACARDLVEVIQVLYELDADVNAVQDVYNDEKFASVSIPANDSNVRCETFMSGGYHLMQRELQNIDQRRSQ